MSDLTHHHDMCDLLSDTAYITRVCTCERATAHDAEVCKQVAEAIFDEEQKAFRAAGGEVSVDTFRNGYCLGLQRARDIAEEIGGFHE